MEPPQLQWRTIPLTLDNEAFRKGFLEARRWSFADIYGEDGRAPQEPHHATTLTGEEVLRLVIISDEQGRYHFDEMSLREPSRIPGLSRWLPGWPTCPR